ncbi:MAG: CYTH domain-containing protein [Deltaproteobacteria bacterium]|nr:CYTH domain-containing protein [Deltaproteobacteria bacterium]MCW5807868.1 CYTH domain-containing protein [Deltaproteobacteria bacterium]
MAHEIERKFLVDAARWNPTGHGTALRQGYLSSVPERTVRVRLAGERAVLTVKGLTTGVTRTELEYEIPVEDARILLDMCERPLIEKVRHVEDWGGTRWEIDVFGGDNAGLVLAEVELPSEDAAFARPPWLGREVSDDARYYNANLVKQPFTTW